MNTDNYEVIYWEVDKEYGVYCSICDKLCRERYYKDNLKSQTHTNNIHKRNHLK